MARDVFISYQSADKAVAERLCSRLESENISCWVAPRDIPVAGEWATAIVEGIHRSKAFVVLLSSNSKTAKQISREAELADQQGLPIITFRLEDVQPPAGLLYFLSNIQWLDAFGNQFDAAAARLADVIRQSRSYPAERTKLSMPVPAALKTPAGDVAQAQAATASASGQTFVPPSAAPPVTPRSEPENTPPVERSAPSGPGRVANPARSIAIGAGVIVVLALLAWFIIHRVGARDEQHSPAGETGAKAVADRFLSERDAGNFEAAWGEFTPLARDRLGALARWQNEQTRRLKHGTVQHEYRGCTVSGTGYICEYVLHYQDGSSQQNTLWLTRRENGSWAVAAGSVKALN